MACTRTGTMEKAGTSVHTSIVCFVLLLLLVVVLLEASTVVGDEETSCASTV